MPTDRRRGIALAALAVAAFAGAAPSPQMIGYQGRLSGSAGDPLNGAFDMTFGLFSAPAGGSALWSETQTSVPVDRRRNTDAEFVKPRAVLGFKTSAQAYFKGDVVPEEIFSAFRKQLKEILAGSEDERLRRRAIRTILAELGLHEEWLQDAAGDVNRTQEPNVAT